MNGEDVDVRQQLAYRSKQNYLNLLGNKRVLIIGEAQKIPEVGAILKLIVDDRGGQLHTYEFKWNPGKSVKEPVAWKKGYENTALEVIHRDNYLSWIRE